MKSSLKESLVEIFPSRCLKSFYGIKFLIPHRYINKFNTVLSTSFFVGFTPSPVAQSQPSSSLNVDFESVFGNKTSIAPVDSSGRSFKIIYY